MGHRGVIRFELALLAAALASYCPYSCSNGELTCRAIENRSLRNVDDIAARPTQVRGGGLRGRVVDDVTGKPAAGVVVTIQATKQSFSDRTEKTTTDANGEFELLGLPPLDFNLWVDAADRTCAALNSISVVDGEMTTVPDLRLIEGSWLEGHVLTLRGEPVSRDPKTGNRLRIGLHGPARPRSGTSFESCEVNDDGRFRLRVPVGRNFPHILQPDVWQRIWLKDKYERGIEVMEAGTTVAVNFRLLENSAKAASRPPRRVRDPLKLPPPVADEWDCAETIRDLGGWYQLDEDRHVVEINMVYNDQFGRRFDNSNTDCDEALRIAP